MNNGQRHTFAFIVVTILFFMWGFITVLNDILIPHLKEVFHLGYAQTMLVNFAFFGAYFVISVVYFIVSILRGDPIQRIGYKNGIILALLIAGAGCSLFYVAGEIRQYWCFLVALFVLASGITILQIAANPYVAILGRPETASGRLNLSQAFNSLGTTLAPLVGGYLIFKGASGADAVKVPYLGLAAAFWLLAAVIRMTPLPAFSSGEQMERSAGALQFRQLRYGMGAIFFYVGGEVAIGSVIINYLGLPQIMGMKKEMADAYVSYYWGGAMIGRFMGAVAMSETRQGILKYAMMLALAAGAFGIIQFAVYNTKGYWISDVEIYLAMIAVNFAGLIIGRGRPALILSIFSVIVMGLVALVAGGMSGRVAMWLLLSAGLFNSIMWSNIFTLSIAGLGKHTSQASSLLVMMIVGGALVPLAVGALADIPAIGLQKSILLTLVCYGYLLFYGLYGYRSGKTTN